MVFVKAVHELYSVLKGDPYAESALKEMRPLLRRLVLWLFVTEFVFLGEVYPVKWFYDGIVSGGSRTYLLVVAAVIGVAHALTVYMYTKRNICRVDFGWRFFAFLWNYSKRRQLEMDVEWHSASSTGEKESIIDKNIDKIESLVDNFLFDVLPVTLRIVFTCVAMFLLVSWQVGLLSLATIIGYAWVVIRVEPHVDPLRKQFNERIKRIEQSGTELTMSSRVIKQLGMEGEFAGDNERLLLDHWRAEQRRYPRFVSYMNKEEHVLSLSRGLLYGLLAMGFTRGSGVGYVALATSWMSRTYSNFERISSFQYRLNQGAEALREIVEFLKVKPRITQPKRPTWRENLQGAIEFRNVSLSYANGKKDALRGIDLAVQPNQTVALVGYTGCGKSSLASLLLREYDPTEGIIAVDGIDLRALDYVKYRTKVVAAVTQRVQLFDRTVRENIRIGNLSAPEGAEIEAAQRALAHEFIETLQFGYDSPIGEDGNRLSGGQRQRLAIARALIRKPKILILDEATSALDAETQEYVQMSIDKLIREKECTMLIIAHRFSTIMTADVVVVMNEGRIDDIGTHEELMRKNGIYKRLLGFELKGMLRE